MKFLNYIVERVVFFIGKIKWKSNTLIQQAELDVIKELLIKDYYIILTKRKNHVSTFFVCLAHFLLTGKWGYWSHSLMNLEDEVNRISDFRLLEATGTGVHYSSFSEVFSVHSVVLLKPKNIKLKEWTGLLDRAKLQLGKPYDTLFNIKDENKLSCVELIRLILEGEPNYLINFPNFESLIKRYKNLSPQMFYDSGDFEIVYQIK